MRRPWPILALLLTAGCAGASNVSHIGNVQRAATEEVAACSAAATTVALRDPRVVRVYFDRDGDLYPGPESPVQLTAHQVAGSAQPLRTAFATRLRSGDSVWTGLANTFRADAMRPGAWRVIQDSIRARVGERIRLATGDGARPLVILIHGYRVPDAECDYQEVRDSVRRFAPDAGYLLVNWDGLTSTNPLAVWGNAQFNFPLVGLGLRRLLNGVNPATPVRVLTHSSGGPVAAHAFWDASGAEGRTRHAMADSAYLDLIALRQTGTLPSPPRFDDLRIGMVVPATPASAFPDPARWNPSVDRVVIGFNPRDAGVGKVFFRCTQWGDTCLGARRDYVCDVWSRFTADARNRVMLFDFSRSRFNRSQGVFWDDHAWTTYLQRDDMPEFLSAVFAENPPPDEGPEVCGAD